MPKKILVVDNSDDVRKVVKKYLTDSGLSVVITDNGSEALLLVRESQPDLILVDEAGTAGA